MPKRFLILALALQIGSGLLWLLSTLGEDRTTGISSRSDSDNAIAEQSTIDQPGLPGEPDRADSHTSATPGPSAIEPPSLMDTDIDGAVELDANGQLIPSLSLRRLFDQVLSSVGELSIAQIRQLLANRLDHLTTPEGKRQALAAFERYLRYLQSVDAAASRLNELPFRERLAALSELRRQHLGSDMAEAFFADEEAYQRYTLDRRDLAEQTGLTPEERAARARELLQALPESSREPYVQQLQTDADMADAEAIETLSSNPDERYRQRRERFGEEAAARMELLDRERQAWDQRVAAYQRERARWQSAEAAARDAALSAYLAAHFSEAEQRRIRSLEDVGGL
ncbi:MAG: lipase secretion chaperone [Lysobacterales bacterium]